MQLDLNQSVTGNDLAIIVEGDSGTYIAQNNNQFFVVISTPTQPLKSLRPLSQSSSPELWTVTKISLRDISEESGSRAHGAAGSAGSSQPR